MLTQPCVIWTGATNGRYGVRQINGRGGGLTYVHRLAYEQAHGPIPEGYEVDHLCFVSLCYEPTHLEAVTRAENLRRSAARITHCPQGHPYDEANTYVWRNLRRCRKCLLDRQRRRTARRRAAA